MRRLPSLSGEEPPSSSTAQRNKGILRMMYRMTETPEDALKPLLPDTTRLLEQLEKAGARQAGSGLAVQDAPRIASYLACPEINVPILRFHIVEANDSLLRFGGLLSPGFEVLHVNRAGFQYHWRSDLVRAFDEGLPIISRFHAISSSHELTMEHVVVPIYIRHRIREIRGWFTSNQDMTEGLNDGEQILMFRRSMRARAIRLPSQLAEREEKRSVIQEAMGTFRARWAEGSRKRALRRAGKARHGS
jgi:hypothetical protein